MSKSKVISVRVSEDTFDEILLQAAREKISVTEWLQRRIAIMNIMPREKEKFLNYLDRTEYFMDMRDTIPGLPVLKRAREFANIIP